MAKTETPRLDSIPPLPLFTLNRTGVELCNAYLRLASQDRQKIDELLLTHAFLPTGTTSYLSYRYRGRKRERNASYQLFENISRGLGSIWFVWAREMSETCPSRLQCRDAILGLLSRLVHLRALEKMEGKTPFSTMQGVRRCCASPKIHPATN
jgi:hypothetical protein